MTDQAPGGMFIWFDLTTSDSQRAKDFYAGLFGWTYTEADRGEHGFYRMVSAGDRGIGGLVTMAELGMPDDDVPPHFMPYMFTNRVDGVTARAVELGATVYAPPRDIPDTVRFSVVGDPTEAPFAPMQPLMGDGPPSGDPPLGSVLWYEHTSSKPNDIASFYAELFGYSVSTMEMEFGAYRMLNVGETPVAGISPEDPGIPFAGWTIYVRVANIDESLSLATSLGGEPLTPAIDVPETGRTALVKDPTGAVVGLIEPSWL